MYSNISLKEKVNTAGLKQVDIKSPNGLIYTIIDNLPDNSKTYLKLSYLDEVIFELSIDKFNETAVFDTEYFKQTKHHYLFRMDKESLKLFLDETERCITVPYSVYFDHYLFINNSLYQLDFTSHELNFTSNKTTGCKSKWVYTYSLVSDSDLARIVSNHSVNRRTIDNYPRESHYGHYMIVGDHFQLLGVFNGHFQDLFSLRYSTKTSELHLRSFKNGYSYLSNQSIEDLRSLLKSELFDWLEVDGDDTIKHALKHFDFEESKLIDALKLLEMAII
jgi:hypothetical protein